jgi:hypothetical protein
MKRQSVRLITTVLASAGVAGCFSDPASSLQNGPAAIQLTRSAVYLAASGDSVLVEARLVDAQGSILPMTGASWSTDNAGVADVHVAAQQLPGDGSTKAYIIAATNSGGVTTVRVTSRGVSDFVRVTQVTNTTVPGTAAVVAGDTVTVTAPAGYAWDPAASSLLLGGNTTYLLSRSATVIKALARAPYTGVVKVTHLFFSGGVGANFVPVDSLPTNSVTVARATLPAASAAVSTSATLGAGTLLTLTAPTGMTFDPAASTVVLIGANSALISRSASTIVAVVARPYTGTVMVTRVVITATTATIDSLRTAGNSTLNAAALPNANVVVRNSAALGANAEMKVTPPAGMTFSTTSTAVVLGAASGTKLVNTADSIVVISTNAYTGTVKLTNLNVTATGSVIDSMRTVGASTINAAPFPGTFVQKGVGGLLDTILVIGGASADFTTSGASASNVTINSGQAFVLRRAADTLYVLSNLSGTSVVGVSNVLIGTTPVSSMSTAGTITISQASTETDEPANNTPGALTISLAAATQAAPYVHYGTVDGNGVGVGTDADDFYSFTLASARTVTLQLQFGGTGGGGAVNPDVDLIVCSNLTCSTQPPGGLAGATGAQPENATLTNLAAGTYHIYVNGWDTASKTVAYKLIVY